MKKLVDVPVVDRIVVYLDYNIFVDVLLSEDYQYKLNLVSEKNLYTFPFTHIHISEVNRIPKSNDDEIQKRLELIKKISKARYLDYREDLKSFTIRDRDPFEVFDTINDVPQSYLDEISRIATEQYLESSIPDFPADFYRMEDQFVHFANIFRGYYPSLGEKLNNMTREEAIKYLEENTFNGISFEESYELLYKIMKDTGNNVEMFDLDFFIENTLYMAGFKTPNKELKKPSGLLSDHQHLKFAENCPIVISNDKNFRNKLKAKYKANEKLVLDLKNGINFLLVQSGVVTLVSKETGKPMNDEFIRSFLEVK